MLKFGPSMKVSVNFFIGNSKNPPVIDQILVPLHPLLRGSTVIEKGENQAVPLIFFTDTPPPSPMVTPNGEATSPDETEKKPSRFHSYLVFDTQTSPHLVSIG